MFLTFHDDLEDGHQGDYIFLRNLQLSAIVGEDAWGREGKIQPAVISLRLRKNIDAAGQSDNINDTVSYGQICKEIMGVVEAQNKKGGFGNMDDLCNSIKELAVEWGGTTIYIRLVLPKASLHASGGVGLELDRSQPFHPGQVTMNYLVNDLRVSCIIGVNAHERLTKQVVIVNLQLASAQPRFDYKRLTADVIKMVESSTYETLEALATEIARISCLSIWVLCVKVSVEKPSALAFVDGAGVEITRRNNGTFED